jgi:hypothetical protein
MLSRSILHGKIAAPARAHSNRELLSVSTFAHIVARMSRLKLSHPLEVLSFAVLVSRQSLPDEIRPPDFVRNRREFTRLRAARWSPRPAK